MSEAMSLAFPKDRKGSKDPPVLAQERRAREVLKAQTARTEFKGLPVQAPEHKA